MASSTTRATIVGCSLWLWEPFMSLESGDAQMLWLMLYTSPEAKMSVPGLWIGNVETMSDIIRRSRNATWNALDELVRAGLVEFDQRHRIARLLQLPDAHERAHNDKAIYSWWTRFKALPGVPIRDAHVPLLWWMISSQGKYTPAMEQAWTTTFGTIAVPISTQPLQRPSSYDTGTPTQPSLFSASGGPINKINNSGPPGVHPATTAGGLDPEPDLDRDLEPDPDPEKRPTLALVPPCLTPESIVGAIVRGVGGHTWHGSVVPQHLDVPLRAVAEDLERAGVGHDDLVTVGKQRLATGGRLDIMRQRWPDTPRTDLIAQWASTPGAIRTELAAHREQEREAEARIAMAREMGLCT